MFSKELTSEEGKEWAKALSSLPIQALRSAFERWNRENIYFPKLKQILDLVAEYKASNITDFHPCNACENGWVVIESDAPQYKSGKARSVKRCQCWWDWRNGVTA